MAEAEELVSDAARHATIHVQRLWRRYRPLPEGPPTVMLVDIASRLDLLISAVTGSSYPIRIAQPPAWPTLLARFFRRVQTPWQQQPIPATDGQRLWLQSRPRGAGPGAGPPIPVCRTSSTVPKPIG